ncbi:MAG: beta-galactosidase, partial [Bacteroidaceae bacterium]|nr:beta-galactosidase [Bacteroidaceae bacterium]
MKKTLIALFAGFTTVCMAQGTALEGFDYSTSVTAPTGKEWQSPGQLALNKEQPRAWMFSFATQEEALRVLPENSTYYRSLDGTWKFRWVPEPSLRDSSFQSSSFDDSRWDDIQVPGCWNVQGLQKDGTMKYGVPIYVNQKVIFQH